MKGLSFSKLTFLCALFIGAMVLWTAAAPSSADAGSILGGGGDMPNLDGCECTGTDATETCTTACGGWQFTGCTLGENSEETTCSCDNDDQACDDECGVCDAACADDD